MSRVSRLLLSLLLLLGSFTLLRAQNEAEQDAPALEANSRARIVRLSFIDGGVQVDTGAGFENATLNIPISEGTRLHTDSNGWAEVQFEDGSTVRLAPGTELAFAQLARTPSGKTLSSVDLDQGEAEFNISAHDGAEFGVTARTRTILLKHSSRFRVTITNSDPLEVAVFKGEVAVRDTGYGKDIAVKKNETFTLDVLDSGRYDLEKEASADELDRWSDQRDHDLSSYASAQNYTQSPYQYGVGDLGYYGQFYDIAGYGNLWQPYGIYPGWDPFMNGYWNYSPGFGYCWVSAYPWGWMPYRYGHWVFINGRGWFWQPGAWSGWARAPRFVNPPHGFQAPAPPPLRAGTGIAPGRQPGISIVGGRPSQPGRVRIDQDEPSVRMPGHPGEGMGTRPAIETRHQAPPPATSIQEPAAPAGEPAHHESAPAPRVEREQPHPLPHVEREPARPIAPPPASVPHSEPAPHVAPPAPSVPHSAPAPHISAAPHVSAPVHK